MPVAQLDRVSDSDSDGCRFESCQAHHKEVVTFLWQLLYLMLITGFERAGSRIVTTTYTSTKNNATKQPMKRLFAAPSRDSEHIEIAKAY